MAGTVVFQVGSLATPGPGIVVGQDNINGTAWQYVKIDVGPAGTSVPASYAAGTGLPVQGIGTFQALGTFQSHGTAQVLGSVQAVGTFQVLGSVQAVGTAQVLGTVRTIVSALTGENFFGTLFTGGVTNGTLVPAPAQGTYVRVFDMMVSGSAAGTAFIEFGDGTAFAPGIFAANGGFVFNSARGVRTHGTSHDILFNAAAGSWGVSVNYSLET